jgi:hypothetical protein
MSKTDSTIARAYGFKPISKWKAPRKRMKRKVKAQSTPFAAMFPPIKDKKLPKAAPYL